MNRRTRLFGSVTLLFLLPTLALACLWDYDTLKQERARFPSTLELITGKFLRHSKEFYLWRIDDRLTKLKADPSNVNYYDDLAVAYEKTGQHAKAIETILAKDKIKPGLYETYSNLGTFYILAGEFEKGVPYIDKAMAINPDAHFGREQYQKWLVKYALSKSLNGKLRLPLNSDRDGDAGPSPLWPTFEYYLCTQLNTNRASVDDLQQAVKGILGMMRFANHDNPLLLEALGDLLLPHDDLGSVDAKRLAARAYLKASYSVNDEEAKVRYRQLAKHALLLQTVDSNNSKQLELESLEKDFKTQLADADKWYAELAGKEASWIREGKDADVEFDKLYQKDPQALAEPADDVWRRPIGVQIGFFLGMCVLGIVAAILIIRFAIGRISRRRQIKQQANG